MPGPPPKRSEERIRRNADNGPVTVGPAGEDPTEVDWTPGETWHPEAVNWFLSLRRSGQQHFYTPSDVATARVGAIALSELLHGKFSAVLYQTWSAAATDLLSTEAARRRVNMELDRKPVADPAEEIADAFVTDLMAERQKRRDA